MKKKIELKFSYPIKINKKFPYLTKNQNEKLNKLISKQVTDALRHFKKDGWDLDFNAMVEDIMFDFIGNHISNVLLYSLLNKGYIYTTKDSIGGVIRDPNYIAVYYDSNKNDIIVVDPKKDKRSNYLERDGYVDLGRL